MRPGHRWLQSGDKGRLEGTAWKLPALSLHVGER